MSTKISPRDLSQFQPLDSLNPEHLKEITEKLVVTEIAKGKTVFKKGDVNDGHLYLLKGKIEILDDKNVIKKIKSGSEEAKPALAHVHPRNVTAIATSDAVIIKADSDLLDMMLTWGQTGTFQVEELETESEDDDWMSRILQTEAFRRIPPANIQAIFTSLKDTPVNPGDTIIKQGDPGDYFYIIKTGRCMVTRKMPGQNKDIKLAELNAGDSFGEEALISDAERNASVVMLTKGVLSRLSKEEFLELLNEPMLDKVPYATAKERISNGDAEWLDVRLPAEYDASHIKGSMNVPLIFLRMKAGTLDDGKKYILCCDTGSRSSSASFILNDRGFTTFVLDKGIKEVPNEDLEGKDLN